MFFKGYGPKASAKNPLEKLKGINASTIPPCESEHVHHIRRSSFVARMWANADKKVIHPHPAVSDGWSFEGDCYDITWFEGPQLPEALVPGEAEDDEAEESNSDEEVEPCSSDVDDILSSDDEADICCAADN